MRNKILDAAEELFIIKGFDHTSTNDIMQKAGIARGTLYNHFKSKEDVLDGVIGRMTQKMLANAAAIAAQKEQPVLGRLTMAIMALNAGTVMNGELAGALMEQMHKPQNALMHQKSQQQLIAGTVPILGGLIREGQGQGIFQTEYGDEALEMIMLYANVMFDDLEELDEEKKQHRLQGFIYNIERLLGTKPGAMQQTIMSIFEGKQPDNKS